MTTRSIMSEIEAMSVLESFSSVALFGSKARGDSDLFSDRDLLVISESAPCQKALNELHAQGFSPAAYSWGTLNLLSIHGSLFLLHIKLESKILKDDGFRLAGFLSQYEPSKDYSGTFKQSIELASLTSGVPQNPGSTLWAVDVLAVALRNYLVALAAQNGLYIFAYKNLIDFAEFVFKLDSETKQALIRLRELKAVYRNKGAASMARYSSLDQLHLAQVAFSSISGANIVGGRRDSHEFATALLNERRLKEPWYHSVRRYEGVYRAIGRECFSPDEIDEIERQIAAPSCYMHDGQQQWKALRRIVINGYLKYLTRKGVRVRSA